MTMSTKNYNPYLKKLDCPCWVFSCPHYLQARVKNAVQNGLAHSDSYYSINYCKGTGFVNLICFPCFAVQGCFSLSFNSFLSIMLPHTLKCYARAEHWPLFLKSYLLLTKGSTKWYHIINRTCFWLPSLHDAPLPLYRFWFYQLNLSKINCLLFQKCGIWLITFKLFDWIPYI